MKTNYSLIRNSLVSIYQRSRIISTKWIVLLMFIVFGAGCKKVIEEPGIINPCPVVVSTDPTDKAVDVLLNKVISVTFNAEMDPATITNASFFITQGAIQISGKVAATSNASTFTFTPTVPLLPFTAYTGIITTAAKDKFGTAMVSNYVWNFTTIPQVRLSSNPSIGGTTSGAGTFAQSSVVTVSATPSAGYTFTNWTDSGSAIIASTSSNYQFTMSGNRTLVANFTPIPPTQYAVMLSSSPAAGGTTFGQGSYNTGTTVTVIESPNPGYTFVNWTENGNVVSTGSSYQFVITSNRTLVANFRIIPALQYAVFLSSNPPSGGTTSGTGSYTAGTSVMVNASANSGYTFTNWTEGGNIVSTSSSYTFPLNGNRTLVANFSLNTYTLNVSANPAAGGSVSKNPDQPTYNQGTTVQLTAVANTGYTFSSWSGDASGSANPLTVTMNSNKNIVANFTAAAPATLFSTIFGAIGGNAGMVNEGKNTVINNGAIGTTGVSTIITGFHDGLTGDVYTETGDNIGLVTLGIYTAPPPPGTLLKQQIVAAEIAKANTFYISISPANRPATTLASSELGGLTLTPGTYKSPAAQLLLTTGDLTLDAQGDPNAVFVFQAPSSLTVGIPAAARSVKLKGNAQARNIYWYVGTAATINGIIGGGVMEGTIIADAAITFSTSGQATQTVLNGRAISFTKVTTNNTTINVPN